MSWIHDLSFVTSDLVLWHLLYHLTWCRTPLKGCEGTSALVTKTSPCLMTCCLGLGSLSLRLVLHQPLWLHLLIPYLEIAHSWTLSCVALPLRGSPHMTLKGTNPSLPWDILMLWSIMMMEWTKLIFTNLSSILTLHFVDCTVYM